MISFSIETVLFKRFILRNYKPQKLGNKRFWFQLLKWPAHIGRVL